MDRNIKTERLTLGRIEERDSEHLIALMRDELVKETYMLPDLPTDEGAMALFNNIKKASEREDRYVFAVRLDDRLIGMINDTDISGREVEIGYAFSPRYHNRGYASEAARATIDYLFSVGFDRVVAGAFAGNAASFRVMEKCGMHKIDKVDKIEYRGTVHDCFYYVIDKEK